jgi:predicted alpha/beta-fold hydrolase
VLAVLDDLRQATPPSPITLVGFSLGGNVILKLAGELQTAMAAYCTQVIAICPPADLATCSRLLARPSNRLYERHFVKLLKVAVASRHAQFTDLPRVTLPQRLSLYEFDNLYTAPMCGFYDADDYYARCSAAPLVPQIAVPCRILFAADDPVIDSTVFDGAVLPPHIHVQRTAHGGHLGFLGIPGWHGGYRWLDALLLEWIGPRPSPQ